MHWLDKIPLWALGVAALILGLAPFFPEPHLWQKLKMLTAGTLTRPIDIFDLVMHSFLPLLVILKVVRMTYAKNKSRSSH